MNNLKIIAFVGMPGTGKDTCANYLSEKYGWPVVHFGNMVYDEVKRRGLNNVKDEIFVREDMRKQEGLDVLAKQAARKAEKFASNGQHVIIFDGLYSWSEYKYLEQTFGENLIVIALAAPKKLRRQRVLDRQDGHRKYTIDELIKREVAEIENIEKGGPIAYADYTIVNVGSPEQMLAKLNSILKEISLT
ncbi:MAG: AAA family ATPase [Candidatus Saccharimonadales bacterium]